MPDKTTTTYCCVSCEASRGVDQMTTIYYWECTPHIKPINNIHKLYDDHPIQMFFIDFFVWIVSWMEKGNRGRDKGMCFWGVMEGGE